MKISTKGRYALRVMLDLAANSKGGEYVSLAEISGRQEVSLKYLEAIVAALSKAGFLDSRRGKNGRLSFGEGCGGLYRRRYTQSDGRKPCARFPVWIAKRVAAARRIVLRSLFGRSWTAA